MSVCVCLQNAVVTAANSYINNYSKNIISLQLVGSLSSVDPWASARALTRPCNLHNIRYNSSIRLKGRYNTVSCIQSCLHC